MFDCKEKEVLRALEVNSSQYKIGVEVVAGLGVEKQGFFCRYYDLAQQTGVKGGGFKPVQTRAPYTTNAATALLDIRISNRYFRLRKFSPFFKQCFLK